MRRLHLALLIGTAVVTGTGAAADAVPTLNDILNASQLDVRSSPGLPRVQTARVLEVSADAPLRQAFRTGPNVTRLDKIAIWFSGWSADWTPEKSLVLRLYAGADFSRVLAEAEEPYSRRLWEGAVHQFTLNVPVAQNAEYTFELSTLGGRSITGAAVAEPPIDPAAGPLTRNGELLRGALWFETIVKRRSDLDRLYLDVFSHFDLQRPDLRAVRDAVAAHDWDRAKAALVAHFEARRDLFPEEPARVAALGSRSEARLPGPTPKASSPAAVKTEQLDAGSKAQLAGAGLRAGSAGPAAKATPPDAATRERLADADLAVDHKFRAVDEIVDLGPRWNHLAIWRSRGGDGITRSGLRGILASAYGLTHDEKYARAWDAMLRFQFEDLPSPLRAGVIPRGAVEIPPAGEPGIGGGSMWASLSIAARMTHGFAYYRSFRRSRAFGLDTRFAFIANLAEMSDVLERMRGGGKWEAQDTTALLEFGETFPEFARAQAWQARGYSGALQSCLDNTFPDGPLREASTSYHVLSLSRYLGVLEGARRAPQPGPAVPAIVRDRVEKMSDYILGSTMPNGKLPPWGDSNPPVDAAGVLLRGADYFGRADMRWVATGGKSGMRPAATSTAFPDAGYYIIRSGWSPDAAYLALHNGPSSAHGHADANSFVLSAFGNELLIDPGVTIYDTPEARLLARTVSHNTVTMDDQGTANQRGDARWTSGWWTDIYEGANGGYEGEADGDAAARHRRTVLFLKPALFLVVDTASAARPHDWTLRDHFAPGTLVAAPDARSITFRPRLNEAYPGRGRGGLRVWSAAQDGTHLAIVPGLASGGWGRKVEAPVASWSQFQSPTAHWVSLLEPFAASPPSEPWTVQQDEHGTTLAYQKAGQTLRFLLVRPEADAPLSGAWVAATGFTTDAAAAVYEQQPALSAPRTARSGAAAHGPHRRLALHDATLYVEASAALPVIFRAEQPVSLLEVEWQGDTLTVHRAGGSGIALRTFGARTLLVNGKRSTIPAGHATVRLPD
jgi:hypothetical protein